MAALPESLIELGDPAILPETDEQWADLLRLLPGYDPFRGAAEAGMWFDIEEAERRLEFFHDALHLVEGKKSGQPFILERWQQSFVANLFGWKRADGSRRYREALLFVPRKNGKTPFTAGILLSVMLQDHEPTAQIYSAAAEQEQAKLIYKHVKGMIEIQPELSAMLKVYKSTASVEYARESTVYKAISAEAFSKHGYSTHFAAIDELHAHPNGELVEVLETSTGAREQPLVVFMTTADFDRESICNERHDYAEKVRDGVVNDLSLLPAIYQIDQEDDWTDERVWAKANPNLGVSLELDYMRKACKKAQEIPRLEAAFRRLHLNQKTQSDVVWISLGRWDACAGEPIDEDELKGMECFGGLDLANTMDINAFVMAFPREDGSMVLLPRFWIPEDRAREREKRDRVPYLQWAREGWIRLTPGETSDYDQIKEDILEDYERFNIRDIGVDRWNSLQIANQLQGEGLTLTDFGQGYKSMNAPSKHLEVMVVSRKLWHGGNPVLRWMASNCRIQSDPAGNIKPTKQKSTEKIDGIVAAVMGLGRWMASEEAEQSVYETRGVIEL